MLIKLKKHSLNKLFKINFFKKKKIKKKIISRKLFTKKKKRKEKLTITLGLKFFQFYYVN